ncbi:MAG: Phytanoyl-CoA dioxygenase [Parcubacteria group bacterium Greene0416_79]|nr:MAG: Phytanoyl-CoA dioxygenase [Parcubacteria group bacterium Greene0416_79]
MVIDGLGLQRERVIEAARNRSYTGFVFELRAQGANFDPANVAALKRAIAGYNHDDETRKGILAAAGLTDNVGINDAVRLNILDDLEGFYFSLTLNVPLPQEVTAEPVSA